MSAPAPHRAQIIDLMEVLKGSLAKHPEVDPEDRADPVEVE